MADNFFECPFFHISVRKESKLCTFYPKPYDNREKNNLQWKFSTV